MQEIKERYLIKPPFIYYTTTPFYLESSKFSWWELQSTWEKEINKG